MKKNITIDDILDSNILLEVSIDDIMSFCKEKYKEKNSFNPFNKIETELFVGNSKSYYDYNNDFKELFG